MPSDRERKTPREVQPRPGVEDLEVGRPFEDVGRAGFDAFLALARWENEGGFSESRSQRAVPSEDEPPDPGTSATDRANRFPRPIITGSDADDGR